MKSHACPEFQSLADFKIPPGSRGRTKSWIFLWQLTQAILFRLSPQPCYRWRRIILRCFGAKVGRGVRIRPTARVTYPWKVAIGDWSWIGDNVEIYSLAQVVVGSNVVISQYCYLCTGSHKVSDLTFAYDLKPIHIEDEVWLATDVFVAPGVTVGKGAVVGARSSVFRNIPAAVIAFGSPAREVCARGRVATKHTLNIE
jgi:putative colanic acid biosynthesis acetyltransferase WcaF